jgi:MFS family permease
VGGAIVDRHSRRTVLIAGDLIRGLALTAIAAVLWLGSHSVGIIVAALFAYSLLEGTVGAVWQPATLSVVPDIVPKERLNTANAFLQGSFQICTVLGQAVAGILFRAIGAPLLLLFDAATYFYASVSDAFIRVPPLPGKAATQENKSAGFKKEIVEGLRYVHRQSGMRTLFYTMAFFQVVMVPMFILFPFYVEDHLRAGPQWYGFLLAASGLGNLLGYGIGGGIQISPRSSARATVVLMVVMSLCLAGLAGVHSPWPAFWLIAAVGAMNGYIVLRLMTILQMATASEIRGRVFGLLTTLTRGLTPFAMGLTGLVADLTHRNIPLIYSVCGGIATLLAANIALRRDCRAFLAGEDESAERSTPPLKPALEAADPPVHARVICQFDSLPESK